MHLWAAQEDALARLFMMDAVGAGKGSKLYQLWIAGYGFLKDALRIRRPKR